MSKVMSRAGYLLVITVFLTAFALPPQVQSGAAALKVKQQNGNQQTMAELAMNDECIAMLINDLVVSGFQVSKG